MPTPDMVDWEAIIPVPLSELVPMRNQISLDG
jgi:hypothetical protein